MKLHDRSLKLTRRLTSIFLQLMPPLKHCDAVLYMVVERKPNKVVDGLYGNDVRLEPCYFDWEKRSITIFMPLNINPGITSFEDLDPSFYETVEAAFLTIIKASYAN